MPYPFGDIAFTPAVKAAQDANGSRAMYEKAAKSDRDFRLGPREAGFIAARDHFYLATVSETGWPYVQHRGGPPGFIQILDERRFAFPDFRGNRQYVSVGNLSGEARASFFFMDYPNKARLKALAHVAIKSVEEEPEIIARFAALSYDAAIERVFIATIAALDWNCPQHITPRFSAEEMQPIIGPILEEVEALRAEIERLKTGE